MADIIYIMDNKTTYKKISRNIRLVYAALMLVAVAFVALCEWNVIPVEGLLVGMDAGVMYVVEVGMLAIVGVGIFAALKGYDWLLHHWVLKAEGEHRVQLYQVCNISRVAFLAFLVLLGIFFYYGTLENWGMYYALAAFVSLLFCLPSTEGVVVELNMTETYKS